MKTNQFFKNKLSINVLILLGSTCFRIKTNVFLYSSSCQLRYIGYIQYKGQNP